MVFCFLLFKDIIDIYDGNYILLLYICPQTAAIISLTVTNEKGQENDSTPLKIVLDELRSSSKTTPLAS